MPDLKDGKEQRRIDRDEIVNEWRQRVRLASSEVERDPQSPDFAILLAIMPALGDQDIEAFRSLVSCGEFKLMVPIELIKQARSIIQYVDETIRRGVESNWTIDGANNARWARLEQLFHLTVGASDEKVRRWRVLDEIKKQANLFHGRVKYRRRVPSEVEAKGEGAVSAFLKRNWEPRAVEHLIKNLAIVDVAFSALTPEFVRKVLEKIDDKAKGGTGYLQPAGAAAALSCRVGAFGEKARGLKEAKERFKAAAKLRKKFDAKVAAKKLGSPDPS